MIGSSKSVWGFDPRTIPGCQLWLDGADSSTITGTTSVTAWRDKSGNGYIANSFVNSVPNPSWVSNLQNGNSVIQYTAGNGSSIANFVLAQTMSIFMIYYPINQSAGSPFLEHGPNVNNESGFYLFSGGGNNIGINTGSAAYNVNYGNTTVSNTWQMIEGIIPDPATSNIMSYYVNGTVMKSESTQSGTTITKTLYINGRGGANNVSYNTYLAELIIYNIGLTTSQRQQVEGYLAHKWGIGSSSIPSTHPFYSIRPHLRTFQPIDVPGCQLWLDAADQSSMTLSGSSVVTILDKSGNGNTLSGGSGWTYNVTKFNSTYPSFYRATTGSVLGQNNTFSITSSNITVFFVGEVINTGGQYYLVDGGSAGINRFYTIIDTPTNIVHGNSVNANNNYSLPATVFQPFIFSQSTGTSPQTGSYNGTEIIASAGTVGTITWSGITVGGRFTNASDWFSGHICEVLIYTTLLTTSQRQQVEGYLAHKWGLSLYLPVISPLSIPGCQLWLDAADSSTVTGTTAVTQWRDKSGNNSHLGVGSGTTSYSSSAIVLNSSYMFVNSPVNLTNVTVFIVTKSTGGNNQTVFTARPNSGWSWNSFDGFGFYIDAAVPRIRFYGDSNNLSQFNVNTSTTRLFSFQSSGTSINSWLDGTSQSGATLSSTRTSTAQGFAIGAEWNRDQNAYINVAATCSIYEIIVYNSDVTATQRQTIEGYLAKKWGISISATLPSPHPFRSIPPASAPTIIGLVNRWIFNNGSGSTVTDRVGGQNISLSGTYTWSSSVPNSEIARGSLSFDGYSGAGSAAVNATLQTTTYTMTLWYYHTGNSDPAGGNPIIIETGLNQNEAFTIATGGFTGTSKPYFYSSVYNGGFFRTFSSATPLNTWTHLAITIGNSKYNAYQNGVLDSGNTNISITSGLPLTLNGSFVFGKGDNPYGDRFGGSLFDVRIYNRALTASEISQVYNGIG